jgi:NAD(P)-dependent dehydrogenase (short-subunit alcohol dehydrogenase family)
METLALIEAAGGQAIFVRADVSDEEQVAAMVAETVARHGRLDWAHNNAAVNVSPGPIVEQDRDRWDRTVAVTLTGTMLCLKHEIIQMRLQGDGGTIVNTASTGGLAGQSGQPAYVASKWGVVGLTKAAALENASAGIRVNAICPGMTETGALLAWLDREPEVTSAMIAAVPFQRLAQPEEQARVAVWLCSSHSSYITGAAVPVDGGSTA